MNFIKLKLSGPFLIKPNIFKDQRGFFFEKYTKDKLNSYLNYKFNFLQENQSLSYSGVFRGLHFQTKPFEQAKLVCVNFGKILDIIVDIRFNSPTYGKHIKIFLDSDKNNLLFIPRGFAHGFLTLENNTIVNYKVDNFYSRNHERSLNLFDPQLKINLKKIKKKIIMSKKDKNGLFLKDIYKNNKF